jgi:hypothetical protein
MKEPREEMTCKNVCVVIFWFEWDEICCSPYKYENKKNASQTPFSVFLILKYDLKKKNA